MQVPHLLLEVLENLADEDFEKFKWFLTMSKVLDGCTPIPKSRLEKASRAETVGRMMASYRDESAACVTAEVLKKMGLNDAAEKLENAYGGAGDGGNPEAEAAATTSSASAPAAPVTVSAHNGAVAITPMVSGGSSASLNITVNK